MARNSAKNAPTQLCSKIVQFDSAAFRQHQTHRKRCGRFSYEHRSTFIQTTNFIQLVSLTNAAQLFETLGMKLITRVLFSAVIAAGSASIALAQQPPAGGRGAAPRPVLSVTSTGWPDGGEVPMHH